MVKINELYNHYSLDEDGTDRHWSKGKIKYYRARDTQELHDRWSCKISSDNEETDAMDGTSNEKRIPTVLGDPCSYKIARAAIWAEAATQLAAAKAIAGEDDDSEEDKKKEKKRWRRKKKDTESKPLDYREYVSAYNMGRVAAYDVAKLRENNPCDPTTCIDHYIDYLIDYMEYVKNEPNWPGGEDERALEIRRTRETAVDIAMGLDVSSLTPEEERHIARANGTWDDDDEREFQAYRQRLAYRLAA